MKEARKPIRVDQAIEKIIEHVQTGETEIVDLFNCTNRIIAEDVYANYNIPPYRRSGYDGFAIRSEDIASASVDHPILLRVISTIAAEEQYAKLLQSGEAVRIMTGSKVPNGADAVVMFEAVKPGPQPDEILITKPHQSGANISREGEDIKTGTLLISKGERLTAGKVAILATFNYQKVSVFKRPRIGIFASGNELVEPGNEKSDGMIMNSNAYMLIQQIKHLGAEPIYFGILKDALDFYLPAMEDALQTCDFVVSTGGVSMGDYDYTLLAHQKLGAELLFHKISMRPGSVTSASVRQNKILFGLSGNPSACFVGAEIYVRTAIRKFMGCKAVYPSYFQAILAEDFLKMNPYTRFVRAKYEIRGQQVFVRPSGKDQSSMIHSLLETNALMILPGGTKGFQSGDVVQIIPLDCTEGSDSFFFFFKS